MTEEDVEKRYRPMFDVAVATFVIDTADTLGRTPNRAELAKFAADFMRTIIDAPTKRIQ
jgi:hypothetical protein